MSTSLRTEQSLRKLERHEFHERFQRSFVDPRFIPLKNAIAEVEEVAWKNYYEKAHKRN